MPKPSSWLLIAALGAVVAGCHKPAAEADAASSRGLKVEAYDAPIRKAPLGGKLETMRDPEALAASSVPAPSSAPAAPSDSAPVAEAGARLAIVRIADRAPAAPLVAEPHHDLYDNQPARPAAPATAEPSGFRITVPMCRRADSQNDPLAKTAECVQLIEAAKAQAEACRQAFENGDDKAVLSPACRQAASFR